MFNLMIKPLDAPASSLFKFNALEEATEAAHAAMANGYHYSQRYSVILGDGSLLNVMSDEAIEKSEAAKQEVARSGGLIQNGRYDVKPEDFVLHIQFGVMQLPPLTYKTAEVRDAVIHAALKTRRITYIFEEKHDRFYIMLGSGSMLIAITGQEFIDKRLEALEMHQKAMAAAQRRDPPQDPRILLPFGTGRRDK